MRHEARSYPKPGPVGGTLIRAVVGLLRKSGIPLPITSHILIATSAGPDSLALARLITKYGRRVVDPKNCRLLHLNHGWRGVESEEDARHVRRLAKEWGVPCTVVRLKNAAQAPKGESLESHARDARKREFESQAARRGARVLTAHHRDDLAETLIWRLLTGQAKTHGAGIRVQEGIELRPLLRARKRELIAFLAEEGVSWREDRTNSDPRFMRARLRQRLMPLIETEFPRAIEHLGELALSVEGSSDESEVPISALFGISGQRVLKSHWATLEKLAARESGRGEMDLGQGWKLKRERVAGGITERWILEKGKGLANS